MMIIAMLVIFALPAAAAEGPPAPASGLGSQASKPTTQHSGPRTHVADTHRAPGTIDVNRPRSPFDCELPIGESWYGSRARCLAYLCGGQNVYNEYVFDPANRRRRNPCYGQNPTEFPED